MEMLQSIGIITLIFLAYKFIYLPYAGNKKEQTQDIERSIGILSHNQKDMMELFKPYKNYVERRHDDDIYHQEYGGWIKLFGQGLHFSSDTEMETFKKKAIELYQTLINDETEKVRIQEIFREDEKRETEKEKKKEIASLGLKKLYLEYDEILREIMSKNDIILSKKEIMAFLAKRLNKSDNETEILFKNLADRDTGILTQEWDKNGWLEQYRYFGDNILKIKLEQL
jgi:hypothetical protein